MEEAPPGGMCTGPCSCDAGCCTRDEEMSDKLALGRWTAGTGAIGYHDYLDMLLLQLGPLSLKDTSICDCLARCGEAHKVRYLLFPLRLAYLVLASCPAAHTLPPQSVTDI